MFDEEGHVVLTPSEVHAGIGTLDGRRKLTREKLIPGTPAAFPTFSNYVEFLDVISSITNEAVTPNDFLVRGSAKVGFSITPKQEKLWKPVHERSDIDLAIISPTYFGTLDSGILQWQSSRAFHESGGPALLKKVRQNRGFSFHSYAALPSIPCVARFLATFEALSKLTSQFCDQPRTVNIFVYRDWASVYARYEFDLHEVHKGCSAGSLPLPSPVQPTTAENHAPPVARQTSGGIESGHQHGRREEAGKSATTTKTAAGGGASSE